MKLWKRTKSGSGKGRKAFLLLSLFILALCSLTTVHSPLSVSAAVPGKFTYQGNIRQAGFLVNGTRSMVFRIYPSSSSAVVLWTSAATDVLVSTGVFRATLEPVIADWESGSLWLELEVAGVKLSPREELTSAPYAINTLLHSGKKYTNSGTAPLLPNTGDLWMNTALNTLYFWNGAGWTSTAGSGAVHAITHAEGGLDAITNLGAHTVSGAAGYDGNMLVISTGPSDVIRMTSAGEIYANRFYGDGSALTGLGAAAADNLGNHTATRALDLAGNQIMNVSTLTVAGNAFSVGGSTLAVKAGNVGIGTNNPQTSLDILSAGTGDSSYTQIWRDSNGVIRASMTASGKLYADVTATGGGGGNNATFKVATSAAYNGNRGGYDAANALCDSEYAGSHICTNGEILFSINSGVFVSFPSNTTLWISNGPPGFTVNANDCIGWTSAGASAYGAVWNKEAAGNGFGSLNKCDGTAGLPRKFACCI